MSDELNPCPFCGGDDLGTGGDDKFVGVWCRSCQATGPNHYGRHEWNTRADTIDRLTADNAKLREALSLIAVVGYTDDPKVAAAIAKQTVDQARAALKE